MTALLCIFVLVCLHISVESTSIPSVLDYEIIPGVRSVTVTLTHRILGWQRQCKPLGYSAPGGIIRFQTALLNPINQGALVYNSAESDAQFKVIYTASQWEDEESTFDLNTLDIIDGDIKSFFIEPFGRWNSISAIIIPQQWNGIHCTDQPEEDCYAIVYEKPVGR